LATSTSAGAAGNPYDLLLKVTPPRLPRHLVSRARLFSGGEDLRGHAAFVVQAPAGFGKTSLLAQWRREYLVTGAAVAWVSAQSNDHPHRLVQSLALAVRLAIGRPAFGRSVIEADAADASAAADGLASVTEFLADLVQAAPDVVLIVDEAERLPSSSRKALAYLLRNAPSNVRLLIAARPDFELDIDDLIAYGQCVEIGAAQLRFSLEDTLKLVHERFGARVDHDATARLHALTEGWPLGLQLALTLVSRGDDASANMAALVAHGGQLQGQLVRLLLADLAPPDRELLTRLSILDPLHPDLCRAVADTADAGARLARLASDTPLFTAAEHGEWLRMHALARDVLRQHFAELDAAQQAQAHARAAQWLDDHGFLEQAARHALAAGQREKAYDLAERSLYESLMQRGRQGAVLEWLGRLPADELDRRPRLLLAAAWTLAASERHPEAQRLVERILAQPMADEPLRCECALILGGAAAFADDPDRFVALHAPWTASAPLADPLLQQVHANRMAYQALLEGEPALARLRLQQAPRSGAAPGAGYIGHWSELLTGLSYMWEGQVLLAERLLRPAVAQVEAELGRRNRFSCMLAALLAAASWDLGRPDDAAALLADRLDVLEHSGLPESLLLAYQTAARIATAEGEQHRVLELLGALDAAGVARNLPRLRIASLADRVRLHAQHRRAESCRALCGQIDALLADPAFAARPLWRRDAQLRRDLAHGYAAIAAQNWRDALAPLERADELARQLGHGRTHIELLGLRALALERCGEASQGLIREAMDLAGVYGLRRVFSDAHPDLGTWVATLAAEEAPQDAPGMAMPPAAPAPTPAAAVPHGAALTPKEREVLQLLARNLSNKEIGRAMQVGETTTKWHVKNLFAKLEAGTRKQVVQRARILGLIGPDA